MAQSFVFFVAFPAFRSYTEKKRFAHREVLSKMKHSLPYDHYYRYQEIADLLHGYEKDHPELFQLSVIGRTPQGRDILACTITNTATGKPEDKPAYYMEANIHAGEVTGSMVAIYFLDTLMSNLEDSRIQQILDRYTLYVVPRLSCDGSEHYLTTADYVRSAPRPYPTEKRQSGLHKGDIDGDGVARLMRVPSPYGVWKISPKDPRLMVRRRPDETDGEFYNVYPEGIIENYDGLHVTMAPSEFGNDFNRNYPIGWQDESQQAGAGAHPLSNPETQANAAFLLAHPNVCCVVDMHTAGGQILYTPGYKSAKDAIPQDMALYRALGKMGTEENGFPLLNIYDEYMPASAPQTCGGFDDFCHFLLGVPAFTIECWDLARRAGVEEHYPPKENLSQEEEEEIAVKYLRWMDENLSPEEGFLPWKPFQHPQLGPVEIGGANYKQVSQNPPIKFLEQELEKHTRFILRLIPTLPRVCFDRVHTQEVGTGLYLVEVTLGNRGFMPTYVFREGLKYKTLKELTVTLSGDNILLPQKDACKTIGHLEGFSSVKAHNEGMGPTTQEQEPMQKKVTWLVQGQKGETITLLCQGGRIGKVSAQIQLGE